MVFVGAGGDGDSMCGEKSISIVYQFIDFENMTTQSTLKGFTKKSIKPFFISYRQLSRERWQSIRDNRENNSTDNNSIQEASLQL